MLEFWLDCSVWFLSVLFYSGYSVDNMFAAADEVGFRNIIHELK